MKKFIDQLTEDLVSSKYDALSQKELDALLPLAVKGCSRSQELIINSLSRMVYKYAGEAFHKNEPKGTIPMEYYYQEGLVGVFKAITLFKVGIVGHEGKTKSFISYASDKAKRYMQDLHKKTKTTVSVAYDRRYVKNDDLEKQEAKRAEANILVNRMTPTNEYDTYSSYSWLESDEISPLESAQFSEAKRIIHDCIQHTSSLTDMQKLGVYATVRGLSGEVNSLDDFANAFGISHEAARIHGKKGLKKLEKNNGKVLRSLLELYN